MSSEGVAKFVELTSSDEAIIQGLHDEEKAARVASLVRTAASNDCEITEQEAGDLLATLEEAKASDVDGFAYFSQAQSQIQAPVVQDFLSRYSMVDTSALARISKNLYP